VSCRHAGCAHRTIVVGLPRIAVNAHHEDCEMNDSAPPQHPVGPFAPAKSYDEETRRKLVDTIQQAPRELRNAVADLSDSQLETRYKNWSVRQIVHHLADSHVHSYIRFKWALTEEHPTIKAYEEGDWVMLEDSKQGDIQPSLALLDGLHRKWVQVLSTMTQEQFSRTFHHPQTGQNVALWTALTYYEWHCRHHTGQILWLRKRHNW
jgi:hypothetical protein